MTDYEVEYQNNPSACGDPFPEFVAFFERYSVPQARILDVGCGQGRDALMVARCGHTVDGVDVSPTGIEQMLAQARAEKLKVNGEVADIRDYLPGSDYDVVLLDRVIHMLAKTTEKEELLEKAKRATAEEGFVLIADTPGNMAMIEAAFSDQMTWDLVFRRKGFRFYMKHNEAVLSPQQSQELLSALKARFEGNMKRHQGLDWANVQAKLEANPRKLWSLNEMERTGGEPDVVGHDTRTGEYVFFDCSAESPKGRRSVCYDGEALESRKSFKPENSAVDMAAAMGTELLTEEEYRELQQLGKFDTKTSSWVKTPAAIRKLGGALFCDRRYDHVFVYHNGAESYYAARGFRGSLRV